MQAIIWSNMWKCHTVGFWFPNKVERSKKEARIQWSALTYWLWFSWCKGYLLGRSTSVILHWVSKILILLRNILCYGLSVSYCDLKKQHKNCVSWLSFFLSFFTFFNYILSLPSWYALRFCRSVIIKLFYLKICDPQIFVF